MTEPATNVHREWLDLQLQRDAADLVDDELFWRAGARPGYLTQAERLDRMMPYLALKDPCFYLRCPKDERAMTEGFWRSFDRKILLNYCGAELLPSLVEKPKWRGAREHVGALARVLRGDSIQLPASIRGEIPRIIQPKAGVIMEATRELIEDLITRGRPEILRLLKHCVLLDLAGEEGYDRRGAKELEGWPETVAGLIDRRRGRERAPLLDVDYSAWESNLEALADKDRAIAPWLEPCMDLPGKLMGSAVMGGSRCAKRVPEDTRRWALELSGEILLRQRKLLKKIEGKRNKALELEEENAMLRKLEKPKKFRDLVRMYRMQYRAVHEPVLSRLLGDGRAIKTADGRYVAATRAGPEPALSNSTVGYSASRGEHRDGRVEA